MKTKLRPLLALFVLPLLASAAEKSDAKNCGCSCCTGKEVCCCYVETSTDADKSKPHDNALARHPLRGVIVDVRAAQSALLVKHEAIPDYMRAMTMLFKVDAATLQSAKKGQAITATLVEREDGFWLENVQPDTPSN